MMTRGRGSISAAWARTARGEGERKREQAREEAEEGELVVSSAFSSSHREMKGKHERMGGLSSTEAPSPVAQQAAFSQPALQASRPERRKVVPELCLIRGAAEGAARRPAVRRKAGELRIASSQRGELDEPG